MKYGYVKLAAATPAITVGDCSGNARIITEMIADIEAKGAEIVLFPELSLTSACCGDLFTHPAFLEQAHLALDLIVKSTLHKNTISIVGAPVQHRSSVYNCAVVIYKGEIKGIVPKNILNNSANENRWFTCGKELPKESTARINGKTVPFNHNLLFSTPTFKFGVEIGNEANAPVSPGAVLATEGATIILNPNAGQAISGSFKKTKANIEQTSSRCKCAYLHAGSGWGESTSNSAYSGYCAIAECGEIIADTELFITESHYTISEIDIDRIAKRRMTDCNFQGNNTATEIVIDQEQGECKVLTRRIRPLPFIPEGNEYNQRLEEVFNIQANALARRIAHVHANTCVIGISGGLDSTLALLVAARACDICGKPHSDITAITMPGFGTTERTHSNAYTLMENLGVTIKEISIKEACLQHFKDIAHNAEVHDITYENSQARERTQILMDIANQQNGIVIGTGDLSELALGWATYNGDHMSMYSVNASVPKTLIRHIVKWATKNADNKKIAETLLDIIDTPVSPELVPAAENGEIKQKTEDLVGPYELHDFFIFHFIRNGYTPEKIYFLAQKAFEGSYTKEVIKKWLKTFLRRFFIQQFKRSCSPDGPITGSCNLNPQIGWTMPSDTCGKPWNEITDNLE